MGDVYQMTFNCYVTFKFGWLRNIWNNLNAIKGYSLIRELELVDTCGKVE